MIRVGIIGFGKMGRIRAEVIRRYGRGEIACVYDPNISQNSTDLLILPSIDDILNDGTIDAVFICTPNYLNRPLTLQALRADKHVFCEKPPAFNASEVEDIRKVEKKSGKRLMYGFNHRHHSSIQHMKRIIDEGEYGDVLWLRGRYGKSVDASFYSSWRSKKEMAGGGILLDQGIHMLDLFLYLGGEFDEIEAFISNLYWKTEIEDNVFAILRNRRTGVVASLHSTMTQWRHLFSLEVFLSRGYIVLNGLKTSSGTYGEEVLSIAKNRSTAPAATWEDEERIVFHEDISWRNEIDHFFDTIENGVPVRTGNSSDALVLMRTIDMIYRRGRQ